MQLTFISRPYRATYKYRRQNDNVDKHETISNLELNIGISAVISV